MRKVRRLFEKLEFCGSKIWGRQCAHAKGLVVIVASAHKVGSTWLFQLIADLGKFRKIRPAAKYHDTGTLVIDKENLSFYFNFIFGNSIFKSHSDPPPFDFKSNVKIVNIYRDPRDVIVSNIFYLTRLEQKLGGWGEDFRDLSETQRIMYFIENGEFSLIKLEQWYSYQNCYQVRYEDLLINPKLEMQRLLQWIGLSVKEQHFEKTIQNLTFNKMKKNKPDGGWFFRKGISGDWKNYFDPVCVERFKKAKSGRWNNLLLKMGYEKDNEWTV